MKSCKRCLVDKSFSEFYKHKAMGDGYLSFCKGCTKSRVSKHRDINLERIQEYDRNRPNKAERSIKGNKRFRTNHPEQYKAHTKVNNAIRSGKLVRECCYQCQAKIAEGHHEDYTKPLDVIWLCIKCHHEYHKLQRKQERI